MVFNLYFLSRVIFLFLKYFIKFPIYYFDKLIRFLKKLSLFKPFNTTYINIYYFIDLSILTV